MPNIELAYSVAFILSSRKEMEHDKYQIGCFSVADISYVSYGLRFLFINAVGLYSMELRKNRFASVEAVEKVTGMTIPDFKVIRYLEGRTSFNGDYSDTLIIVFDSVPSESFYKRLNCFIASDSTGWMLDDEVYSFSTMWGNGFPSPKGEDVEEDMTFYIEFCKGSRIATIIYGAW